MSLESTTGKGTRTPRFNLSEVAAGSYAQAYLMKNVLLDLIMMNRIDGVDITASMTRSLVAYTSDQGLAAKIGKASNIPENVMGSAIARASIQLTQEFNMEKK